MLITNNAYLILWLSSDADEKLLNKRHKEILKLLEIDEIPEYENDFSFINYKTIRTAEAVKWAFHELSNQRKRLYQDFLWFQLATKKDETYYKELCKGNIIEAIEWWWEQYQSTWKFHYLKNRAIALLLWFEHQKKFEDLDFSGDWPEIVKSLHECIKSDKFWKEFLNIVNLSAETPISDVEMNKFRSEISQILAEEFFDLSEELKTPKLYIEYNKVFWVNAKELDDNENVTKPLSVIENNSRRIQELDLELDLDEIIDLINEIEEEIKKLKKIWLAESPKIIKIRDNVASSIRGLGISLYNDYWNSQSSKDFIEEAKIIAWSVTLQTKIKEDIKIINENILMEGGSLDDEYDDEDSYSNRGHTQSQVNSYNYWWQRYSQPIDELIPVDELRLTVWEIYKLVLQWWKFVYFPYCYSLIFFTQKEPWTIYFKAPWASWFWKAIGPILWTLVFWWRWFPWWPIYSLECIFSNLFGGKDVTDEVMEKLRSPGY